jgi:PPOX class probable FMN-dependent enzyme
VTATEPTGDEQAWTDIATETELRDVLGEPSPRALSKERTSLHAIDRAWIAASPFVLVATAARDGSCDVSPKGDPPGFVHVLDDRTLAIPERPGNKRADGWRNVLSNPHVGLIFLVPGRGDTLRVNGRARLVRESPFFDDMVVQGHRPLLAAVVDIEQVFFHCSKAFLRSRLWEAESWGGHDLPTRAVIARTLESAETPLAELEAYYGTSYADNLYRQ